MLITTLMAALQIGHTPPAPTPIRQITQLVHTTWTPRSGGGPIGIRELTQTTDGYIWIGSFFGLWRFDGVRFVRYTPLGGDSIPEGAVTRLLADRDGSLWLIGGRNGLVIHLRGGRVATFGKAEGLGQALDLAESSKGLMVAGTLDGISRLSGGRWEDVRAAWGFPGKHARSVWFDRDDTLWAVTDDRVVYLPPGASRFLDPGIPLGNVPADCRFAQEEDGTVWLSLTGESVRTLHKIGDRARKLTEVRIDPLAAIVTRKGSLWVATGSDGLRRIPEVVRIRGRRVGGSAAEVERFTMKDGLLSDIPTALLEDREGNIWVGSANGLERFREGAFTPFLTVAPARPRYVMAGRDSSVWTGAFNHGALQRFGPHGQDLLHPGFFTWMIAQDSLGRTLVVDTNRILRLEGKRFVPLPLRPRNARSLYSLTIDPAGTLWVYSEALGLLRLAGDSLVQVAELETVTRNGQPFSDSKGTIWVGQTYRVARYAEGKLTLYGKDQGIGGFVYWFFEDRAGTIWAATGDGLSRFEGDGFRTLKRKGQIPGYTVFGMAQDDDGAWWLATMPGILRFPPGEIERAFDDSTYLPRYRAFDESDGMIGALVKGYWGPVLAKSGDGKIWVTTDSGLARIDPRALPLAKPPPVSLEVVRIRGREQAIAAGAELPPGTGDIEIDYTSLTFGVPERIRYRYRLEGVDAAWHDVGDRRRAYYTGLAPGSYRFRVTASYGDGIWNDAGASWSFRVLPAWYETVWFKGLVVLAIGALGGLAVALIQRGRHARAQQALKDTYEATLAERARIAHDLHDTLLQGFAGVTLQLQTVELDLPERAVAAAETVSRVQRLAHAAMREARERVWDLQRTELGSDDLPTALEAMARERTVGTGIEVSGITTGAQRRVTPSLEDASFRIGREAVVNAVKHAGARRIEIRFTFEPARLRLEVNDDGSGFTPEQSDDARRKGHFGLSGIRDRAAHAGGRCEVRSGQDGGTVVLVELPC